MPGDVGAVERDRPGVGLPQADDRLDELVLAVARDAGDPEDLAARLRDSFPRLKTVIAASAEAAVRECPVVVTCTVTDRPYLPFHWLSLGTLLANVSIMDVERDVFLKADKVVVDGNHPLAGMALVFTCTVTAVRPASAEEIAHGHIHDGEHEHEH